MGKKIHLPMKSEWYLMIESGENISFFDDYDSVEKALFNHFNIDEDE